MKTIWRFFASIQLTIALAALICVVAAWGSLLTVEDTRFFRAIDSQILLPWLLGEGMEYLNLTLWMFILVGLTAVFALNTAVCTADRVWAVVKDRRPVQSLFPHIVHVGFLIALLGHLVSSVAGFRSYGHVLMEGMPVNVPDVPGLSVRLDGLEMETRPDGELAELRTTITVMEEGSEVLTDDVMINGPVIYRGVAFYHLDQGNTPTALVLTVNGERVTAPLEGAFAAAGGRFAFGEIFPDFAMTPDGRAYNRSYNYRNPYIEIISESGARGYLSLAGPGATARVEGDGPGVYTVTVVDFVIKPYAVMAIHKDPGIWLIIAGSAVLVVGMVLLLFFRGERGELVRTANRA